MRKLFVGSPQLMLVYVGFMSLDVDVLIAEFLVSCKNPLAQSHVQLSQFFDGWPIRPLISFQLSQRTIDGFRRFAVFFFKMADNEKPLNNQTWEVHQQNTAATVFQWFHQLGPRRKGVAGGIRNEVLAVLDMFICCCFELYSKNIARFLLKSQIQHDILMTYQIYHDMIQSPKHSLLVNKNHCPAASTAVACRGPG